MVDTESACSRASPSPTTYTTSPFNAPTQDPFDYFVMNWSVSPSPQRTVTPPLLSNVQRYSTVMEQYDYCAVARSVSPPAHMISAGIAQDKRRAELPRLADNASMRADRDGHCETFAATLAPVTRRDTQPFLSGNDGSTRRTSVSAPVSPSRRKPTTVKPKASYPMPDHPWTRSPGTAAAKTAVPRPQKTERASSPPSDQSTPSNLSPMQRGLLSFISVPVYHPAKTDVESTHTTKARSGDRKRA